jgi:cell division protein DivIC
MNDFIARIPNWIKNKYFIVTAIFVIFMLFLDDSTIFYQLKLRKEQQNLQYTSTELKLKIKELQKINTELQKNPIAIEKIAREKYGMKKQNETVFLFPETK